jgi:hypothetical protein
MSLIALVLRALALTALLATVLFPIADHHALVDSTDLDRARAGAHHHGGHAAPGTVPLSSSIAQTGRVALAFQPIAASNAAGQPGAGDFTIVAVLLAACSAVAVAGSVAGVHFGVSAPTSDPPYRPPRLIAA